MKTGTKLSYSEGVSLNHTHGAINGFHYETHDICHTMCELPSDRDRGNYRTLRRNRRFQAGNPHVAYQTCRFLQFRKGKTDNLHIHDGGDRKETHSAPTAPCQEQDHYRCHTAAIGNIKTTWNTLSRSSNRRMIQWTSPTLFCILKNRNGRSVKPSCWTGKISDRWQRHTGFLAIVSDRSCGRHYCRWRKILISSAVDGRLPGRGMEGGMPGLSGIEDLGRGDRFFPESKLLMTPAEVPLSLE